MWLLKKFVMNEFAAEVKKGNYKKIDYQTWRELKDLPEEWDINLEMYTNSRLETNPTYSTIAWDGCSYPFEFPANDGSLGEYIKTLIEIYNAPTKDLLAKDLLGTSNFVKAINKVAESAVKADVAVSATAQASNWAISSSNYWKPKLEVRKDALLIDGETVEEKIDKAMGNSINRKENDSMNLFKGFDFGSCENDNVKVSMYGLAVKNATGTWVSYDANSKSVIDVDILNFDGGKYLYKLPVAIKDIVVGDVVIHNRKPMFVTAVADGRISAIDPAAGEEKVILLTKSMFGFDFATKVVNLFGNFAAGASTDAPFGNILPLILLNDSNKSDDMLPLFFMMNGGNFDMSNPMMLYFLMKDNKNSDILPLMLMSKGGISFGVGSSEPVAANS